MMKYTIFFAALFVSTFAIPMFPHFGGYQNANNFDQDDGVFQGQQGVGAQNQGNEIGDTPDDQDEQQFGPGVAPQAGTTVAPAAGDSSSDSSSSEEDMGAGAGGALTTAAPAQPVGPLNPNVAPQAGPDIGAGQAGDNSDSDTNVISQVDAAPIGAGNPDPGNTSGEQNTAYANPFNMQPRQQKQQESRRSSFAVAATTMILVAGVAATAAVTYKYKDTIRERIGL